MFDGLDYYIQVRQAPATDVAEFRNTGDSLNVLEPMINKFNMDTSQQIYDVLVDQFTPGVASRSGVIVSKVTTVKPEDTNQAQRLITLLGPDSMLQPGQFTEDPASLLFCR